MATTSEKGVCGGGFPQSGGGRLAMVAAEQGSVWRGGKHTCGVASVTSDARTKLKQLPVVE
jgi:hypothetical protein